MKLICGSPEEVGNTLHVWIKKESTEYVKVQVSVNCGDPHTIVEITSGGTVRMYPDNLPTDLHLCE